MSMQDTDNNECDGATVLVKIMELVHSVLKENVNCPDIVFDNTTNTIACGGKTVLDVATLKPLSSLSDAADNNFSSRRVNALAQYAVARASECVIPDGAITPLQQQMRQPCLDGIAERIKGDVDAARAQPPSSQTSIETLATNLVAKPSDCVTFTVIEKTLNAETNFANVPTKKLKLQLELYEPRFAGIVMAIFNYLCYAAAVDPESTNYQEIADDTLNTFAKKPAQAGGGRKRAAPRARGAGGRARAARLVLSAPLCPAHWKQKTPA